MKLEVGREYVRRNGEVVRIVRSSRSIYFNNEIIFIDQYGYSYYENGSYWQDDLQCDLDLIEVA